MASCFCTGECKSNPCHPCNGGLGGRPMSQGWLCPVCGRVNAPFVVQCPCKRPVAATPDCGCPTPSVCMNTACPRRIQVTSSA